MIIKGRKRMNENNYIQQLERAVRVLINSNSNWAMNVSDGDEQFIWDVLKKAMVDDNPSKKGSDSE